MQIRMSSVVATHSDTPFFEIDCGSEFMNVLLQSEEDVDIKPRELTAIKTNISTYINSNYLDKDDVLEEFLDKYLDIAYIANERKLFAFGNTDRAIVIHVVNVSDKTISIKKGDDLVTISIEVDDDFDVIIDYKK